MTAERQNIEIKVKVPDLDEIRERIVALGAEPQWTRAQTDTYFTVRHGRLKLRETDGQESATLIAYARSDDRDSRISRYQLLPVSDPGTLKAMLRQSLGELVVVRKARELYLFGNTRVHLDDVEGLGTFVELETVIGEQSTGEAWSEHRLVIDSLRLAMHKQVGIGYSDLKVKSRQFC